jgi:hypothetical protein|tara:strand:- start:171 stop:335 length:165 start_codon:yes stop_codon:yes gene_type:complete
MYAIINDKTKKGIVMNVKLISGLVVLLLIAVGSMFLYKAETTEPIQQTTTDTIS